MRRRQTTTQQTEKMLTSSILEDIIVLSLALNSLLVLWFHDDSFLSEWRAKAELWDNFFGRLLKCKFCLSYQAPFWLLILTFYVPAKLLADPWWSFLLMVPVYSLAVTSVVWMVAGIFQHLQPFFYVRREEEPDDDSFEARLDKELAERHRVAQELFDMQWKDRMEDMAREAELKKQAELSHDPATNQQENRSGGEGPPQPQAPGSP